MRHEMLQVIVETDEDQIRIIQSSTDMESPDDMIALTRQQIPLLIEWLKEAAAEVE